MTIWVVIPLPLWKNKHLASLVKPKQRPMPARYLILLLSLFIISCHQYPQYPEGGYLYPKNMAAKDTIYYTYQLRDSMKPLEKWRDDYVYIFYKAFNEPNLSIHPQPKETFRFVYGDAFGNSTIIVFNKDSLTVKTGNHTVLYDHDTTRLSAIENLHLKILDRWFPIDTAGKSPWRKRYLDSMMKLYPQLLDPVYYHAIYEKSLISTGEKFTPEVTKFPITKPQYDSLVLAINASGFWAMPWDIDCESGMADGYGFHLEANTSTKYKIVQTIGCPGDSSAFTKACQKIVEAAKMNKSMNLVWKEGSGNVIVDSVELQEIKPLPKKKNKKPS